MCAQNTRQNGAVSHKLSRRRVAADLVLPITRSASPCAREEHIDDSWITRVIRLNFFEPQIVEQTLSGNQPAVMTAKPPNISGAPPIRWDDQATYLNA